MPPPPPPPPPQQPNAFFHTVLNNPNTNSHPSTPRARPGWPPEPPPFTATQRSAQARNKDFQGAGKEEKKSTRKSAPIHESYEQRQLRDEAAYILESTEMLMWYAAARNESIPQTRRHYQGIVLGLASPEEVVWRDEWEVSLEERDREYVASPARSGKGKERERDKGKKRVSSGHTHG